MVNLRIGRGFFKQLGWSFSSKIVAAALQLVIIVLLARGLAPSDFARVATANVLVMAVVVLNGFGLVRKMQFLRAQDADDPNLPAVFWVWRRFTLTSALLWLLSCVGAWLLTGHELFAALAPLSVWLVFEQLTSLWNAISLTDGRAHELMPSYLWRRAPVVLVLIAALAADLDVTWAWSLSLTAGSVLAYLTGRSRAVQWARPLWPGRRPAGEVSFDFGFWWTELGGQLRDMDVVVITVISATTGGLYALPARLVRPMNLVTAAAAQVAFPRIARQATVSQRQLLVGTVFGTAPVAFIAAVTAAGAGLLPRLVGEDYAATVPVLRVLCLCAVAVGFAGLVVTFLQARSRAANRFTGRLLMTVAILHLVAAALAASVSGAIAAAWAVTGVTIAGSVVAYFRAIVECRHEMKEPAPAEGARGAAEPSSEA
ncbi:lipopolysaccharide biosynthesis protein [Nocardioides sp.]|uniref:lipopolysaccharide biosynthesis protein n=1 Tax=Nocardioides sp. TaxID=35761 RepID=UPI00356B1759